jgi:hypothetical protein
MKHKKFHYHLEEIMRCPHLGLWAVAACRIDETAVYVPSDFQIQEYCKSKCHKKCPFFVQSVTVKNKKNSLVSAHGCV